MTNETPEKDPRELNARLRELLAIPERLRTDAQWDEIIEIEISQGPKKLPGNQAKPLHLDPSHNPAKKSGKKPTGPGKHIRKHRPKGDMPNHN